MSDNKVSVLDFKKTRLNVLLRVAWPVALSTLLVQLMTIVDKFWIGRLPSPETALSASGVSIAVFGALIAFSQMVNAPVMAFVARFSGGNERIQAQGAFFHGLIMSVIMGIFMIIIFSPLSGTLMGFFGANPDVVSTGLPYIRILIFIIPLVYLSSVSAISLQATGDTLSPLLISLGANVVNLILDPILIFGWLGFPAMGLRGAGVATGIAAFLNLAISLIIVNRRQLLRVIVPRWNVFWRFIRIGFFAMLQGITRPVTGVFMYYVIKLSAQTPQKAETTQAAFNLGYSIVMIFFIFLTGLSVATQSLVGQYLGMKKPDEAQRTVGLSATIGTILQFLASGVVFLFAPDIIRLFSPQASAGLIADGTHYLRIVSIFLLALPSVMAWSGALYGSGKTLGPALGSLLANLVVKLPLAYILTRYTSLGADGVWLAIGISVIVEGIVVAVFYFNGKWKRSQI